jgi:hypothetical protein
MLSLDLIFAWPIPSCSPSILPCRLTISMSICIGHAGGGPCPEPSLHLTSSYVLLCIHLCLCHTIKECHPALPFLQESDFEPVCQCHLEDVFMFKLHPSGAHHVDHSNKLIQINDVPSILEIVIIMLPRVLMQPEIEGNLPAQLLLKPPCPTTCRLPASQHFIVCVLHSQPAFCNASFQETAPAKHCWPSATKSM